MAELRHGAEKGYSTGEKTRVIDHSPTGGWSVWGIFIQQEELLSQCKVCLVPFVSEEKGQNKVVVVRRKEDPGTWALDLDLYKEYPETWGKPEEVKPSKGGICRSCFIRNRPVA
jgi:hypothetical protein